MMNETLGLYLPDCVLDFTEGKRALICGGICKEDARKQIQKVFGFTSVTWNSAERGANASFLKDRASLEARAYEVVFLLVKYAGHHCDDIIVPTAKKLGIPILRMSTGYNPNAFSHAIEEQVCRKLAQTSEAAKSSAQMTASSHGGRPVNW